MASTGRIAILHIGGEKTGTTTLQATLGANRASLAADGVLFSRAAGGDNHINLALFATAGIGTPDLRQAAGLADNAAFDDFLTRFPETLRQEAEESGARLLIYSNEHLSSRIRDVEGVHRLWSLFGKIVDEIRLVYYARPQAELVLAAWSTMLKSGASAPFALERMLANPAPLDHAAVVARWGAWFSDPYWVVRAYQRGLLAGDDIVADFCAATGLSPALLPQRTTALNRTLDAPRAEFLRLWNACNGVQPDSPQNAGRGEVVRVLERLSAGPPLMLGAADAAALEGRFGPGNDALAARFLRREKLFETVAAPAHATPASLTPEQAVAIAAALWQASRGAG
jgi:hypothetical protein